MVFSGFEICCWGTRSAPSPEVAKEENSNKQTHQESHTKDPRQKMAAILDVARGLDPRHWCWSLACSSYVWYPSAWQCPSCCSPGFLHDKLRSSGSKNPRWLTAKLWEKRHDQFNCNHLVLHLFRFVQGCCFCCSPSSIVVATAFSHAPHHAVFSILLWQATDFSV
jgi:hypothetical protein